VIYLEEAVERKRRALGGTLTRVALREAVMEGALLRLRPKVMTVSTVVAGLLPIMWSTRVGAEVMKPLATPVLGGMVSSLVHVLIVTPVIFSWLRERQLGLQNEPLPETLTERVRWRPVVTAVVVVLIAGGGWIGWRTVHTRFRPAPASAGSVVSSTRSGDLDIVILSPTGTLRQGRNVFTVEFRSANGGMLVDVGAVRATGNMTMPGMAMSSGMQARSTAVAGRYSAIAEFGMAGTWHFGMEWDGPRGHGSAAFEGMVQ
jgi:Cu(I)/Ag(I) efflux system membrane protein CusA/SilA